MNVVFKGGEVINTSYFLSHKNIRTEGLSGLVSGAVGEWGSGFLAGGEMLGFRRDRGIRGHITPHVTSGGDTSELAQTDRRVPFGMP